MVRPLILINLLLTTFSYYITISTNYMYEYSSYYILYYKWKGIPDSITLNGNTIYRYDSYNYRSPYFDTDDYYHLYIIPSYSGSGQTIKLYYNSRIRDAEKMFQNSTIIKTIYFSDFETEIEEKVCSYAKRVV